MTITTGAPAVTRCSNTDHLNPPPAVAEIRWPDGRFIPGTACRTCLDRIIADYVKGRQNEIHPVLILPLHTTGSYHRPPVVCLCGSTRFNTAFQTENLRLTLQGEIVLSIGCDAAPDADLTAAVRIGQDPEQAKRTLGTLHRRKIDLADYVLVVSNVSGYFGETTEEEIRYAVTRRKSVKFSTPAAQQRALERGLIQGQGNEVASS